MLLFFQDYFYLLSGGVGHELEHILEEDADLSLVDRTLQTIHHVSPFAY
jgi:hypothetical protein